MKANSKLNRFDPDENEEKTEEGAQQDTAAEQPAEAAETTEE